MPTRKPLAGVGRLAEAVLMAWIAFSLTCIAMMILPGGLGRAVASLFLALFLLFAIVGDGALDGVLGQHRTVNLDRRQAQLFDNLGVLDRHGLIDRHALDPFRGQRRRRNGRAAAEGLELGVLDHAVLADLAAFFISSLALRRLAAICLWVLATARRPLASATESLSLPINAACASIISATEAAPSDSLAGMGAIPEIICPQDCSSALAAMA